MSRSMWVLAALFAILAISMVFQSEWGSGVNRPWAQCKENLVTQMFSNRCTPVEGSVARPAYDESAPPSEQNGSTQDRAGDKGGFDIDSSPLVEQR